MPTFTVRNHYAHPIEEVFSWHTRDGAFTRLTPPGWASVVEEPSDGLRVGSTIKLRLSTPLVAGLLPQVHGKTLGVDWLVQHSVFEPNRLFVDEQVSGPLRRWRHEHHFESQPDGSTVITDVIEWQAPSRALEPIIESRLRQLFAFRARQLRADLDLAARLSAAPSTVLVAGASGLVGTQLCALLTASGHRVVRLVRRPAVGVDEVTWDPAAGLLPLHAVAGSQYLVNLAGHSIGGRFTPATKKLIVDSRLDSTRLLASQAARSGTIRAMVQASAIGFYGARRPGEVLDETSPRGDGFLADVVAAWEEEATTALAAGVRTVVLRTGIALSLGGGALLPQVPLFLAGAGGRLAAAHHWLSWISLDDLVHAYAHALFAEQLVGPINAVAPTPATQSQFATQLGTALRRPAFVPTPAFGPKLVLGAEGYDQLINTNQYVSAEKLTSSGFVFQHPELAQALHHVLTYDPRREGTAH